MCDEGTANSVARVAAVAQVAVGYFEYTVAGKITAAAQSVYRQIKIKIDPFTNVYHTWKCIPGNLRAERRL